MQIIICLDDNRGMLFNNRRLSRDQRVFDDIASYLEGDLHITPFSEKLIADSGLNYKLCDFNVTQSPSDSFYFIENISIKEHLDKIDRLIIYWWNRKYPSDVKLDFEPTEYGFKSVSAFDFVGKSHEKITREIFER